TVWRFCGEAQITGGYGVFHGDACHTRKWAVPQQAMQNPARGSADARGNVEAIRSRSSWSACGSTWSAAIMARTKGSERMSGKVRRFGPSWHRLLGSESIVSSRGGPSLDRGTDR